MIACKSSLFLSDQGLRRFSAVGINLNFGQFYKLLGLKLEVADIDPGCVLQFAIFSNEKEGSSHLSARSQNPICILNLSGRTFFYAGLCNYCSNAIAECPLKE